MEHVFLRILEHAFNAWRWATIEEDGRSGGRSIGWFGSVLPNLPNFNENMQKAVEAGLLLKRDDNYVISPKGLADYLEQVYDVSPTILRPWNPATGMHFGQTSWPTPKSGG